MESYVVKIHHRVGGESRLMVGKVEARDGKGHHFRTAEELWWILLTEPGDEAMPPDVEPVGHGGEPRP